MKSRVREGRRDSTDDTVYPGSYGFSGIGAGRICRGRGQAVVGLGIPVGRFSQGVRGQSVGMCCKSRKRGVKRKTWQGACDVDGSCWLLLPGAGSERAQVGKYAGKGR
jgi:hypothetical protein